jgi:hypothetical protein
MTSAKQKLIWIAASLALWLVALLFSGCVTHDSGVERHEWYVKPTLSDVYGAENIYRVDYIAQSGSQNTITVFLDAGKRWRVDTVNGTSGPITYGANWKRPNAKTAAVRAELIGLGDLPVREARYVD